MKRISILVILVVLVKLDILAQDKLWTLRECCDYAVEHNISIKQQKNQCRQQEVQLSTAKNSRLPDLSASASQNFSFGRGLTAENTYSNTNTSSTSFQLGTSVPLFTGFQIPNQIKMNQLNLEAATADLEKAKDDIRLQVAQAYVQILYDMEISDVARRQVTIDSMQVIRLQAFVDNGKAAEAELSQQKATLANSRLTATQADNNTRLAILSLTQLLELPTPDGFSIVRPDLATIPVVSPTGLTPDAIYAEALTIKPEVQSAQLAVSAAERNVDIAKAGNGVYVRASNAGSGLGDITSLIEDLEKEDFGEAVFSAYESRYQYPLVAGLLCLLAEVLFYERRNKKFKLFAK